MTPYITHLATLSTMYSKPSLHTGCPVAERAVRAADDGRADRDLHLHRRGRTLLPHRPLVLLRRVLLHLCSHTPPAG